MEQDRRDRIYTLVDARTLQVRYVGWTNKPVPIRHAAHVKLAKKGSPLHVHRWLRKIGYRAFIREIEVLEPGRSWQEAEKKWIKYFREHGYPLTNMTCGGDGFFRGKMSESSRKKISVKMKRWFRSHDHHCLGIKYSRERCRQMSRSLRAAFKKNGHHQTGATVDRATRAKISATMKEYRKTHPVVVSHAQRKRISGTLKQWYQTHDSPCLGKKAGASARMKMSLARKAYYARLKSAVA